VERRYAFTPQTTSGDIRHLLIEIKARRHFLMSHATTVVRRQDRRSAAVNRLRAWLRLGDEPVLPKKPEAQKPEKKIEVKAA